MIIGRLESREARRLARVGNIDRIMDEDRGSMHVMYSICGIGGKHLDHGLTMKDTDR